MKIKWSSHGVHGVHIEFNWRMWTPHTPVKLHMNSIYTLCGLHKAEHMECTWSIDGVHMESMESIWSTYAYVESTYSS